MRVNQKQSLVHFQAEPAYKLRGWARVGFGIIGPKGKEGAPRLLGLLNDPDPEVCSTAAICLASVGPSGDQAVSLLTNRLRTATSKSGFPRSEEVAQLVIGLRFFEARAKPAVPLLLPLLKDTDGHIQYHAAWSLAEIDREAAARAGVQHAVGIPQDRKPEAAPEANQQGGANGRQPFSADTNPTSGAAASRRPS